MNTMIPIVLLATLAAPALAASGAPGDGNGANLLQQWPAVAIVVQQGTANVAQASQGGRGNQFEIRQTGNANQASLDQGGLSGTALLQQLGNGNDADVIQLGQRNTALVQQVGQHDAAVVRQQGQQQGRQLSGLSAVVRQVGDGMRVKVIQH